MKVMSRCRQKEREEIEEKEVEEQGVADMEWDPTGVAQGREAGRAGEEEQREEYPFWLRPGTPPRAEIKVAEPSQTHVWVINNRGEEEEEVEEAGSKSEEAPEGGQLPPDFLSDIVDRLASRLGENLRFDRQFVDKIDKALEKIRGDSRSNTRITDNEKRRERRREIAIMIKGKAATQDSDREGEREARAFLGRHYTRQVMDRQRAG